MAVVTDLMQTYDQSETADVSVAEGIHMISPTDTPLQLLLPKISVASVKAEWIEDELTGQATKLASAVLPIPNFQYIGINTYPKHCDYLKSSDQTCNRPYYPLCSSKIY